MNKRQLLRLTIGVLLTIWSGSICVFSAFMAWHMNARLTQFIVVTSPFFIVLTIGLYLIFKNWNPKEIK
jgi:CHASE2 domain-containing sensor protein